MCKLEMMSANMDIKEVFGSHKILDDIEPWDQAAVYDFAKIVNNYLKMCRHDERINEEEN